MPNPDAEPTRTAPRPPAATTAWATGLTAGAGFDEEVRALLRSRLILVHLLSLLCVALLQALSWSTPDNNPLYRPDQGNPQGYRTTNR